MKTKYLTRRGRIELKNDRAFPGILCFQYARFIRARGEVMLKNDLVIKRPTWSEVIKISDEAFCSYYSIGLQDLSKIQNEIEQTNELDLPIPSVFEKLNVGMQISSIGEL